MADQLTPDLLFPYPHPDDPIGGVGDTIEALALKVEDRFRRMHDSNGATSSVDDTTVPGTAYENAMGAGKCQFIAPATNFGRVTVYVSALLSIALTANVNRELWLSAAIIAGTIASPGAEVDPPNDFDAMMVGVGASAGMRNTFKGSYSWTSAILTPGNTYHVQMKKRLDTAGNCSIRIDQLSIRVHTHSAT